MLPLECRYLNKSALTTLAGPLTPPVKHFQLKRKPKSATLRAELLQKCECGGRGGGRATARPLLAGSIPFGACGARTVFPRPADAVLGCVPSLIQKLRVFTFKCEFCHEDETRPGRVTRHRVRWPRRSRQAGPLRGLPALLSGAVLAST